MAECISRLSPTIREANCTASIGYAAADGTSFAAPIVAGAAALVKQAHPTFTAAQIRSALINTSSQDTNVDDQGYTRNVTSFGAGRLDANAAVNATVTASPVSISFGALSGSLPAATAVTITNGGTASATLTIAATAPQALAGTAVTGISVNVDQKSLTVAAGATATFNVSLSGAIPAPVNIPATSPFRARAFPCTFHICSS